MPFFWILYLANEVKKGDIEGLSVNLNFRGANITSISKHFQSIDLKQKLEGLNIEVSTMVEEISL